MKFNYSSASDSEFEEHQETTKPSSEWPNRSHFSSGFFEITEEDAIAYWFSRLKVNDHQKSPVEYPTSSGNGNSESDDVCCEEMLETDQVYYPMDEDLKSMCQTLNVAFKHLPFRKLTYKKRPLQASNWPGYTLFENNGVPTTLMLPRAFSNQKCYELQEIGLASPKRSTKPSDLTLFDLVKLKKQRRKKCRKAAKRQSDSDSTSSPDSGPSKKPRSSNSSEGDLSTSDSGTQEFSSTIPSDSDQSGLGLDSLYCDEVFIDEP